MNIPFTAKLEIADDILFRELDGESVILNMNNENYYGLDEVGTQMWNVLTSSPSIQFAMENLLQEYDVPEDRLRKDLNALIEQLIDKGMLQLLDQKG